MQQRVYQTKMLDVNNLRQCMIHGWTGMQQSVIDDATDLWRRRRHNCMRARGGHFEYSQLTVTHETVKTFASFS